MKRYVTFQVQNDAVLMYGPYKRLAIWMQNHAARTYPGLNDKLSGTQSDIKEAQDILKYHADLTN